MQCANQHLLIDLSTTFNDCHGRARLTAMQLELFSDCRSVAQAHVNH
ncbi:Uncharacterised protein [Vibrio cholerae]|nr:Uncharacterised protein [Vibrio cholerae]